MSSRPLLSVRSASVACFYLHNSSISTSFLDLAGLDAEAKNSVKFSGVNDVGPEFFKQYDLSLFPAEVIKNLSLEAFVKNVKENEVLVEDGELFNDLYIPVSTSILLMSSNGSDALSCIGSVRSGWSTNLFNFLRSLPAAYAFVAAEDGEVLVLPREFLDRLFSMAPEVKKYLLNVTKDPNYRNLMKEFRDIGVSQRFVIRFIAQY